MAQLRFETYDVFTEDRFSGNPLAVVFDADNLITDQMQKIAREFNLSETVFICAPGSPAATPAKGSDEADIDASLRIFTPGYEMPFAGHPTVGASIAHARDASRSGRINMLLQTGVFPVDVQVTDEGGRATFENPNSPVASGQAPDPGLIEDAFSLSAGAIDREAHAPRRFGAGVDYVYARTDTQSLASAQFNFAAFDRLGLGQTDGFVLYTDESADCSTIRMRMFAPGLGIIEDPATGSAAAALPGQLQAAERWSDGTRSLTVRQGVEMGRPSVISLNFDITAGEPVNVKVSGSAVKISSGVLFL
ncbi:MAG: PhzF family phenazine biosynthesis protein [Pseudomonadota bacterium]